MKSAIFLTWFFTIVFFNHGLNSSGAGASCSVAPVIKHIAQSAAATPNFNRVQPVDLAPEPESSETITAAYAAEKVEPAAGDAQPRFNPRAQNAQRYGADAESYSQDKQDHLLQALMK